MIPTELTNRRQWLTWRLVDDTKIPNGKSNDEGTWCDFADLEHFEKIAYVFSENDPFCGVDLDDCLVDGVLTDEAMEIMSQFTGVAYAEYSPSGTGIKLITRAKKPKGSRCSNGQGVECYDHKRFWTITRSVVEGFETIGDGQTAIDWLIAKYLAQEPKKASFVPTVCVPSTGLHARAKAYVDGAEAASSGGRNNAAFRLAGHLFAMTNDGSFLTESEVLELVETWNCRLSEPLSEKELQSVVRSAEKNGTPRDIKQTEKEIELEVDLSRIMNKLWPNAKQEEASETNDNDEDFCLAMVPDNGLLRLLFDFYLDNSIRSSNIMGLAVSLSICETIMGRKVASHTDLRTNDYNLIIAQTSSGKEACESTVSKILDSADPTGSLMLPPNVQSGNGLIHAVAKQPCGIWVCDEFGKTLQAILDKKGNKHLKDIGTNLLTLYGKANSSYGGAAHADGVRNKIINPHLVLLGLSTGSTVFSHVSTEQVADGLIGRIAFWPVQERPKRKKRKSIVKPSEQLIDAVKSWIDFAPGGNLGSQFPDTKVVQMSFDALERWDNHENDIDTKMADESSSRAAVWGRVAARAMKYALIHRLARLESKPSQVLEWHFIMVEIQDVNWGIKLANWIARIACDLIEQNTIDTGKAKAKAILMRAVEHGPVNANDLIRAARDLSSGDFASAAKELGLSIRLEKSGGRPRKYYEKANENIGEID